MIILSLAIMGITVDLKADGSMLLTRYQNNQQIYITRDSWLQLVALKDVIQKKLDSKTSERWPIGNNIYAVTSLFNDSMFLNIRVWWNEKPTKQGVTMSIQEWRHLYNFLHFDDEAVLGISTLEDMLSEAVGKFIKKHCEGCQGNLPSQTDHACVMDASFTAKRCIDNVFDQLNLFEFTTRLAKLGETKRIPLKRPYETFHLIRTLKENELKSSTVSKFDV